MGRSIAAAHGVDGRSLLHFVGSWLLVLGAYRLTLPKIDPSIIEFDRPLEATGTVLLIVPALLVVQPLYSNPTWLLVTGRMRSATYRLMTFVATAALGGGGALAFLALLDDYPLAQGFCAWVGMAALTCLSWGMFGSTIATLTTFLVVAALSINGVVPWGYNVIYNDAGAWDLRIVSGCLAGGACIAYTLRRRSLIVRPGG